MCPRMTLHRHRFFPGLSQTQDVAEVVFYASGMFSRVLLPGKCICDNGRSVGPAVLAPPPVLLDVAGLKVTPYVSGLAYGLADLDGYS